MYIPRLYREADRAEILEFLRQNEFAVLVTYDGEKPMASHLLVEVVEEDEKILLNGHMSKANPQWRTFDHHAEVLVIFQGPHTYISPTWYNHVNVPTWNYQAVHLYGRTRIIEDWDESYLLLKNLVTRHETANQYSLESLPQDFVEKEMRGIVAFQIEATQIEANYKLSQNRDEEDYHHIVARLEDRGDEMSQGVAGAMKRKRPNVAGEI